MNKIKVAILISGRGSNMSALIEACKNKNFPAQIALVISNKEKALGLEIAKQNHIETAFIDHKKFASRAEFDQQLSLKIQEKGCKIVCLAGFMRLLSEEFVKKWHGFALNIHPSLLPNFKGANAVLDALNAKATKTGCTVHFIDEKMDEGEIILQKEVEILPSDDVESLAARILKQEHILYPQALKKVCLKLINQK